jgi:chromosome segregation ATPase
MSLEILMRRVDELEARSISRDDLMALDVSIKEGFATVGNKIGILRDDVSGIRDDVAGLKSDMEGLRNEVGALSERVSRLEIELHELRQMVSGLDERVSGLDERVSGLDERVSGLDERVSGLSDRVSGLEETVSTLKDSMEDLATKSYIWEVINEMGTVLYDSIRRLEDTTAGFMKSLRSEILFMNKETERRLRVLESR